MFSALVTPAVLFLHDIFPDENLLLAGCNIRSIFSYLYSSWARSFLLLLSCWLLLHFVHLKDFLLPAAASSCLQELNINNVMEV